MKKNKLSATLASIGIGLVIGAVVLLIVGYNPIEAYSLMLKGVFSKPKNISWTIIRSTPVILTGIAVAFAFNTGLFNIGAEGQFIVGSVAAGVVGYFVQLPPIIHPIVCILAGILAGILWAGIAGFLKSNMGVHEVISTIMLNWVALHLSNGIVFIDKFKRADKEASKRILKSAEINILGSWKSTEAGKAFFEKIPFLKDFFSTPVNYGFIIAIIVAFVMWYILKKTTLGYQLRAVGSNKEASEFGGINIKKNIIISMMISGGIAGLAGAIQLLGVAKDVAVLPAMEGYGFDGIAVSLIASNNPLAAILSGLLFGGLKYGGSRLQPSLGVPNEIIEIIIGIIVFFIALPKLLDIITGFLKKSRGEIKND